MMWKKCLLKNVVKLVTNTLSNNSNSKVVVSEILPLRENPTLKSEDQEGEYPCEKLINRHALCKYGVPDT